MLLIRPILMVCAAAGLPPTASAAIAAPAIKAQKPADFVIVSSLEIPQRRIPGTLSSL